MDTKYFATLLSSDLMNDEEFNAIYDKYRNTISGTGGEITNFDNASEKELLVYFILGGGTEQQLIDMHTQRVKKYPDEPVYLLAHPGDNSLPASMEILAKLRQEKIKGKIVYLSGNQESDIQLLEKSIRNLKVYKVLRRTNLGLIGKPSDWLVASSPKLNVVTDVWGIKTTEFDVDYLRDVYKSINDDEISENYNSFSGDAKTIVEPNEIEVKNSIKVYSAIKKISEEHNLSSVSVRCFDLLMDEHTTGCFALSKLTDEGIVAGCEGDIVTTIGMIWTHLMFGKSPWMANPARIDINENRMMLAHCTVPRNIVSEYDIRSHFESGIGVGIQGKIDHGPITLLRLGGKDLKSYWVAEGEIINNSTEENLCRTQVEIRLHDRNKLKELLNNPLGNHLVLIHGFFAEDLEEWHSEFIQ